MLETLRKICFYQKRSSVSADTVFLTPSNLLKIFLCLKKSFSAKSKSRCFLINGKKTNLKKNLNSILLKITDFSNSQKNNNDLFFLILVTNLQCISSENQEIFKNFLTNKEMFLKFFFFVDDLEYLNQGILSRCQLVTCYGNFFFQKYFFKRQKIKFKIITNSIYNKDGKLSCAQNNYQENLFHLKKKFRGNSITFKEASLKISKKLSNETFILFIFLKSFKNDTDYSEKLFLIFSETIRHLTDEYEFYKTICQ